LRAKNYFLLQPEKVKADHIYVFVLLNKPDVAVEYFVVPGRELRTDPLRFDKCFIEDVPFSGIYSSSPLLATFKNKWEVFLR